MRKRLAIVLSLTFAIGCFLNSSLTYANYEDIERRIDNLKTAINKEIVLLKFFKKKYIFLIRKKQRIEQLGKKNRENLIRSRKQEIEKSLDEFEKIHKIN